VQIINLSDNVFRIDEMLKIALHPKG